eukprot:TRINITY_DN2023_c0_g1_i1.p1 TRINITY_DN2023_c0_g1~~TRINITY_DN2023_c0_g1_i1.p1  ORF type:complete len:418 (-),score=79.27 TRINITY_DN2023_c0_g1_i1:34-1287(-)
MGTGYKFLMVIFMLVLVVINVSAGVQLSSVVNSSRTLTAALPILFSSSASSSSSFSIEFDSTLNFAVLAVFPNTCVIVVRSSIPDQSGAYTIVASSEFAAIPGTVEFEISSGGSCLDLSNCSLNVTVSQCSSSPFWVFGTAVEYFSIIDPSETVVTCPVGYSKFIGANFQQSANKDVTFLTNNSVDNLSVYVYTSNLDSYDYQALISSSDKGGNVFYMTPASGLAIFQVWVPATESALSTGLIIDVHDSQASDSSTSTTDPSASSASYSGLVIRMVILIVCVPVGFSLFLVCLSLCVARLQKVLRRKFNEKQVLKGVNSEVKKSDEIEFSTRESANCCICLGDYEKNEQVRVLGCGHHFHKECVDVWLIEKLKCPVCVQPANTAVNYRGHHSESQDHNEEVDLIDQAPIISVDNVAA